MTKRRKLRSIRADIKRKEKEMARMARERKEELQTLNHELDIFKK